MSSRFFILLFLFGYFSSGAFAQSKIGIGISGAYNFQTQGIGAGLRLEIPVYDKFSVTPQIYYFPSFNVIHELYGGLNIHYRVYTWKKFTGYALAGGFLNQWFNASEFAYEKAKRGNFIPELGVGIFWGNRCFRPFIEQRYNPKWKEGTLHVGVMFYFGCNTKKKKIKRIINKDDLCPAYQ